MRPCSHPGCRNLVTRGRCLDHTTPSHTFKWFYNLSSWRRSRYNYIVDHPVCEVCNLAPTRHVHHVTSLDTLYARSRGSRPDFLKLALDESNYQGLCVRCHSRVTVEQDGGFKGVPRRGAGR